VTSGGDVPATLAAVHALQSQLALDSVAEHPARPGGLPAPATARPELAFFEQLRTWLQAFPPAGPDQAYQQRFAPLGLLDPAPLYAGPPAELARALAAG
jgi:tRNA U34 5-methylaminomethyl-2-thiouridine-forming methyltransferase MnmC